MERFGVSFSVKQCRNFEVSPVDCLEWLLYDCGFRRFRLMSYWDEIETSAGNYDFTELDKQVAQIQKTHGTISLSLGVKQPRWPESHWPEWAWGLPKTDRDEALLRFIEVVVKRYRDRSCVVSYQLENEALLNFGERIEVDRSRLRQEFKLVKRLDPKRPIIMSTSSSWGIPFRQPIPDIIGFSYYRVLYRADLQKYTTAFHKPWIDRLRAHLIRFIWHRPCFIHELQLEPWGSKNIWEMSIEEQSRSMNVRQIHENIQQARATHLAPIDLWGGEWWFWRHQHGDSTIMKAVIQACD